MFGGSWRLDLARHYSGAGDNLGSRGASPQSAIHARRRVDHGADHPCLYRMVLLGVSRKGWRGWVSLMAARMKRIGWFIAIWAASVAAIGAVGLIIRAVLDRKSTRLNSSH